ncbi:MAG: tetratricopeptide repeat protein [Muribaculum sp.]
MSIPSHILNLIENNAVDEAIVSIDNLIASGDISAEAYYQRGRLHWQAGHRRAAINDYHSALELDPESPAGEALRLTMSIMEFYNKDLYNP